MRTSHHLNGEGTFHDTKVVCECGRSVRIGADPRFSGCKLCHSRTEVLLLEVELIFRCRIDCHNLVKQNSFFCIVTREQRSRQLYGHLCPRRQGAIGSKVIVAFVMSALPLSLLESCVCLCRFMLMAVNPQWGVNGHTMNKNS